MHHIESTRFEKNINKNTKCRLLPFEFEFLFVVEKVKRSVCQIRKWMVSLVNIATAEQNFKSCKCEMKLLIFWRMKTLMETDDERVKRVNKRGKTESFSSVPVQVRSKNSGKINWKRTHSIYKRSSGERHVFSHLLIFL